MIIKVKVKTSKVTVESHHKLLPNVIIDLQSLGCVLYAMCYFKSPFDSVYERGDSVALAVISAKITFPDITPYPEVQKHHLKIVC